MKFVLGFLAFAFMASQPLFAVTIRSSYADNLCLDVNLNEQAGWRFQRNVEVWPCNGDANQQFSLKPAGFSGSRAYFTLQTLNKCLDIDLGFVEAWTNRSNVQVFDCNGDVNQKFWLEPTQNKAFLIRSALDDRCLDIDLNQSNGWRFETNVQLWNCSAETNQQWRFENFSNNSSSHSESLHF